MLRRAAGGGAVLADATLAKFAIAAVGLRLKQRKRIVAAVWHRLRAQPLSFLFPPKEAS